MTDDAHSLAAIENLMREVSELRRRVAKGERSHDLTRAAIDSGPGLEVINPETGEVAWRVGADENGVVIPEVLTGPDPIQPSAPTVEPTLGAIGVNWDGLDVEGNTAPADFESLRIYVSVEEDFTPSEATFAGSIHSKGGYAAVALGAGTWYVRTEVVTLPGKTSPASETVETVLTSLVDEDSIAEQLEQAADDLREAHNTAIDALDQLDTDLTNAAQRVAAAEQSIATLTEETLPALEQELAGLESSQGVSAERLAEAERKLTTAQGELATLTGTTLPALSSELGRATSRVTTAEGKVSKLEGETVPALRADLAKLDGVASGLSSDLREMNGSLTSATGRLKTAEGKLSAAEVDLKTLHDVTLPELEGTAEAAVQSATTARNAAIAAEARATEANNRAMTRLANGNFESGLTYWQQAAGIEIASESHSGGQSALLKSSNPLTPDSLLPVAPGQIWELQLHYRPVTNGSLNMAFRDGTGALHQTKSLTGTSGAWSSSGAIRLTIPAGVEMIAPHIVRHSGGWFYVDDVVLRDVTDVVRLEKAAQDAANEAAAAKAEAARIGGLLNTLQSSQNLIAERMGTAEGRLSTLTGTTLPALDRDLSAAVGRLTTAEGKLNTAASDVSTLKGTTVPALSRDLTDARSRLSTAEGKLNTATSDLTTLKGTTIPALDRDLGSATTRITAAEQAVASARLKVDALALKGDNLVVNGSAELGTTHGWSSYVSLDLEQTPSGRPGAFKVGPGHRAPMSSEPITVDPSRSYRMSMLIKAPKGSRQYLLLNQYDVDGEVVSHNHTNRLAGTETKLTAPMKKGDTVIRVASTAGFAAATLTENAHLAAWPYQTKAGPVYQIKDGYTRHQHLVRGNYVVTNATTLTLPSGWPGPDIPTGADIALTISGGSYLYPVSGLSTTDDWELWTGTTVAGVGNGIYGSQSANQLRPGCALVAVGALLNHNALTNPDGSDAYTWFTGVVLEDDTLAASGRATQAALEAAQRAVGSLESLTNGWKATGTTEIDGGKIKADSVTAAQIKSKTITANEILAGSLTSASGVFGTIDASAINAGTLNAARLSASDVRAKFLAAGKITAADIVTGTLTSASGVFGTIDASAINAGTLAAARLNAGDVRAKFIEAGKITAADMVAGTITATSGVVGSLSAAVLTTGTLDAARLNAEDVRAKFLAAGRITTGDMVAGTITASSGVIASLDASKITAGTMSAQRIDAADLRARVLSAGKITASDIVAGTLTSASGVFGTMDASVLNSGTINAARLNATDVRAKFLAAGKVTASDIVAGSLTSASGVFGAIDASDITAGTLSAQRLNAADLRTRALSAGKITANEMTISPGNLFPDPGFEHPDGPGGGWIVKDGGIERAGTGTQSGTYRSHFEIPVLPGEEYYTAFTRTTLSGSSGRATLHSQRRQASTGAWVYFLPLYRATDGRAEGSLTIPADTDRIRFGFYTESDMPSTTTVRITEPVALRKADANLIVDGSILAKHVKANEITANEIKSGTLTSASGVFGTMDASVINAGTLNTARLNASSLRAHVLSAGKISAADMVAGTITATSGVVGSLSAAVLTTGTLSADRIAANAITTAKIATNAVTANEILTGTITSASGVFGTVDASVLNAGTLNAARIGARSITADKLVANSITANELAANSVTASELTANAVTAGAIAAGAIEAGKLAANAVTADKIAAGAITAAKLDADAINGKTITGAKFQTTNTAKRGVELDTAGFRAWNASGSAETFSINATDGSVSMEGELSRKTGTGLNATEIAIRDGYYGPGVYAKVAGAEVGGLATGPGGVALQGTETGYDYPSVVEVVDNRASLSSAISDATNAKYGYVTLTDEHASIGHSTGDLELSGKRILAQAHGGETGPVVTTGSWRNIARVNGWADVGGRRPARYRIEGNTLRLSGAVVNGTSGLIGTLPVGFRPAYTADAAATKPNSQDIARITVAFNGQITVNTLTGASGSYISLDGITIPLD